MFGPKKEGGKWGRKEDTIIITILQLRKPGTEERK